MKRILQATMAAITVAMTSITTTPSKADSRFSCQGRPLDDASEPLRCRCELRDWAEDRQLFPDDAYVPVRFKQRFHHR